MQTKLSNDKKNMKMGGVPFSVKVNMPKPLHAPMGGPMPSGATSTGTGNPIPKIKVDAKSKNGGMPC